MRVDLGKIWLDFARIFSILIGTIGCNHLFYHPDDIVYTTPDKLNLDYSDFWTKSPDGVLLHGWWIRKQNKKDAKHSQPIATIVQFHGNAQNMSAHFLYLAWMVPLGFDLVVFDYRGYGRSTGVPTRQGIQADAQAVLRWVSSQRIDTPMIVVGQSLGGAVATVALGEMYVRQEKVAINLLVLDSTFSSYRNVARLKLNDFWLTWPLQYPLSFLVSDEYRPVDAIEKIPIPKLVIHGPKDPVVPFAVGQELYERAHPPKEFWTVPWDGHTAAFAVERADFREKLVSYICFHLAMASCPEGLVQ